MNERFFQSFACRSGHHCAACRRDGVEGDRTRKALVGVAAFDCPHGKPMGYAPPEPHPLTVKGVLYGAAGLAKAALGIDKAPDDVVRARLAICYTCEHWQDFAGGRCGFCGCLTQAKVRLGAERCPLNPPRWEAVTRAAGPSPGSAGETTAESSVP